MTRFTELVDLASERLGGVALEANDEFFAPKENLLKPGRAVFIEGKYTDRGKWMDGWETRRRREPGHDWCVVRLGLPGVIRGVSIDTNHFRGNFPAHASVDASRDGARWEEILLKSPLKGDTENLFPVRNDRRWTHVRLNIHPDGGVARFRVFGVVKPERLSGLVDLAAASSGGFVLGSSDKFFGAPQNLLLPAAPHGMWDGWETRRRRGPGNDWVVIQLGARGTLKRVEVDTRYFKGNAPESCSLEASDGNAPWTEILLRTKLRPDATQFFELTPVPCTRVKFNIFPDGGVSRLRVFGESTLRLNSLEREAALGELLGWCGSRKWATEMLDRRPFRDRRELLDAGETIWRSLSRKDWLEAFRAHPRIGEKGDGPSQKEQATTLRASEEVRRALSEANRAYEAKFGHIFLICASGKSAEAMLRNCRSRLKNKPEKELKIAAKEQSHILKLRLEK